MRKCPECGSSVSVNESELGFTGEYKCDFCGTYFQLPFYLVRIKRFHNEAWIDEGDNEDLLRWDIEDSMLDERSYEIVSLVGCPFCYHIWFPKQPDPRRCPSCNKQSNGEFELVDLSKEKMVLTKIFGKTCWICELGYKKVSAPFRVFYEDWYSHNFCFRHIGPEFYVEKELSEFAEYCQLKAIFFYLKNRDDPEFIADLNYSITTFEDGNRFYAINKQYFKELSERITSSSIDIEDIKRHEEEIEKRYEQLGFKERWEKYNNRTRNF